MVSAKFPPPDTTGAVAGLLGDVADELEKRGNQVAALVLKGQEPRLREKTGRTVHEVERGPSCLTAIRLAISMARIRGGFDLIHLHDILPFGVISLWFLSILDMPRLITMHSMGYVCRNSFLWPPASLTREDLVTRKSSICYLETEPDCRSCFRSGILGWGMYVAFRLRRGLAVRALRRFTVIAPSGRTKEVLMKSLGLESRVLWNSAIDRGGVDGSKPSPDLFRPVVAGRAVPEKGLHTALMALSQMKCPRVLLSATVKGRSRYLKALREAGERLGVDVNWVAWQPKDDYLRYISGCSVCVIPTRGFEVFGMTALDAQMIGLPLIVAHAGALPEVSPEGLNSLTFERENVEELAACMDRLAGSPKLAAKMGRMSRKIFERRYTLERHVDRLVDIYAQI